MTTDWPSASLIFGERMRKKMSLLPPGAAGLMTRTVFAGNVCAPAGAASSAAQATTMARRNVAGFLSGLVTRHPSLVTRHSSLGINSRAARNLDPLGDLGLVEGVVLLGSVADGIGA